MQAGDKRVFKDGQPVTVIEVYAGCAFVQSETGAKFTAVNHELRTIENAPVPIPAPASILHWPKDQSDSGRTIFKIEMPHRATRKERGIEVAAA